MAQQRIYLIFVGIALSFITSAQHVPGNDTIACHVKVKLVKAERLPPHCGVTAQALAQQFEIIESSFDVLKPTYKVLLIQPCPESLGKEFFLTGQIYTATISTVNDSPINYLINNATGKPNLLTFWIRQIKAQPIMDLRIDPDNH